MSTYRYITQRAGQALARQLCQVLHVAPAAYYAWQRRQQVLAGEPAWVVAVREAFAQHSQRYGTRRHRAEVQVPGHCVGRWLYLAIWLDRCSRKVVGWDVRDAMPEDLVSEALRRALVVRRPPAGLVFHSD